METNLERDIPPDDLRPHGGANAFASRCASRAALDVIANKWVCLIVGALRDGPARFGGLRRRLDGITQKMLTQTLRELERNGLVERVVQPSVPPRVDYHLTEVGEHVGVLLDGIRNWAGHHMGDIDDARARYDKRSASA